MRWQSAPSPCGDRWWLPAEFGAAGAHIRLHAESTTQAGGLTKEANPDKSTGVRSVYSVGWVGIDLEEALKDSKTRDYIILIAGDSLDIPEFDPAVTVT